MTPVPSVKKFSAGSVMDYPLEVQLERVEPGGFFVLGGILFIKMSNCKFNGNYKCYAMQTPNDCSFPSNIRVRPVDVDIEIHERPTP